MDYLTINSQLGFRLTEIMVKLTIISGSDSRIYRRVPLAYVQYLRFVPFSCLKNYAYKLRVHSEMAGA